MVKPGTVLNRCFNLRKEICQFLLHKKKNTAELWSQRLCVSWSCWVTSLATLMRGTCSFRGGGASSQNCAAVRAFKLNSVWPIRRRKETLAIFPASKIKRQISPAVFPCAVFWKTWCSDDLHMELIELQCNDTLKSKYDAVGAAQFPQFIHDTMSQPRIQAGPDVDKLASKRRCQVSGLGTSD